MHTTMQRREGRAAARTLAALTTAALGLGLGAASATAAPATHAPAQQAPAAIRTAARPPVTSRVDIDGDGRGDRTTLKLHSIRGDIHRFTLTVTTARGKTTTMPVSIESYGALTPRDVWVGVTGMDGVRGNEIVLDVGGGVGDFAAISAYTWRSGKLVGLAAPGTRVNYWPDTFPPYPVTGHTFSMKGNTRYVVRHDLNASPSGRSYSGWNTTYRWTAKGWEQVSRTRTGVYSAKVAGPTFAGLHGLIWR